MGGKPGIGSHTKVSGGATDLPAEGNKNYRIRQKVETSSLQYRHPEKRISSGYLAEDTLDPAQQRPSQYRNAIKGPHKNQRGTVKVQEESSLQPKESIDASPGSHLENYNQFR